MTFHPAAAPDAGIRRPGCCIETSLRLVAPHNLARPRGPTTMQGDSSYAGSLASADNAAG